MLRSKMKGFTLIELMVVIVIIGVLASLAIPRFTEASVKAKVAEAPRVMASYASAQLANLAETAALKTVASGDLILGKDATSKFWTYSDGANAGTFVGSAKAIKADLDGKTLDIAVNSSGTVTCTPGAFSKFIPNFSGTCN